MVAHYTWAVGARFESYIFNGANTLNHASANRARACEKDDTCIIRKWSVVFSVYRGNEPMCSIFIAGGRSDISLCLISMVNSVQL